MGQPLSSTRRAGWPLVLVLLTVSLSAAMMPPMADYTYNDGERQLTVKVPRDWRVEKQARGLRALKEAKNDVLGTALLGFYEFDRAPTPDAFIDGALVAWSKQFDDWRNVSINAPQGRPRVRLATVTFRQYGFRCTGYVMTVSGRETGTIGFCYAENILAKELRLDDLVQLFVAGSYGAHAIRGSDDSEARQAFEQAKRRLYGDANKDFLALFDMMDKQNKVNPAWIGLCGTYQPALRNIRAKVEKYLDARARARIGKINTYCAPMREFNAYSVYPNPGGPGFLVFFVPLVRSYALLAEQYAALRAKGLTPEQLGPVLTAYSERLAEAILRNQDPPQPERVNMANDQERRRWEKVFYGMIVGVVAHEMAHYYLQHGASGQTNDPFSIQQRELMADQEALSVIRRAADQDTDIWEGGVIHQFGFSATLENVFKHLASKPDEPEYKYDHPTSDTRLKLALAQIGPDNFQVRHDPWTDSSVIESGDSGVQVVGGSRRTGGGGGTGATSTLVHPVSKVQFNLPAGWVAQLDPQTNRLLLRRQNANLPMVVYACGGQYNSPEAITTEIVNSMRQNAQQFETMKQQALDTGNPKIKAHFVIAKGQFPIGQLGLLALGMQTANMSHGVMMMTTPEQFDKDAAELEQIVAKMRFPD